MIIHNAFAIPIITRTTGVLDWTRNEIDNLDIRTRTIMVMSGSLHVRSDVERLYAKRAQRDLKHIYNIYKIILIVTGTLGTIPESLKRHLKNIGLKRDMNDTIRSRPMPLAVQKVTLSLKRNCRVFCMATLRKP